LVPRAALPMLLAFHSILPDYVRARRRICGPCWDRTSDHLPRYISGESGAPILSFNSPRLCTRQGKNLWALLGSNQRPPAPINIGGVRCSYLSFNSPRPCTRQRKNLWALLGSNQPPSDYESGALTD